MKRTAIVALAILLAGCTHHLMLVGRTSGAVGSAEVTTAGNHSGPITITLAGKTYTGQWVYAPQGGSVGFGSASAFSGNQSAAAFASFAGIPTSGPGSIIAGAPDGSALRCVFNYSENGQTGIGSCQDNKGEIYDLQIN